MGNRSRETFIRGRMKQPAVIARGVNFYLGVKGLFGNNGQSNVINKISGHWWGVQFEVKRQIS